MGIADKELPVYVCSHVFERTRPVLLAAHSDGDWQFLCGGGHDAEEVPRVIGISHVLDSDPSIRAVLDLPPEWQAERASADEAWQISPLNDS